MSHYNLKNWSLNNSQLAHDVVYMTCVHRLSGESIELSPGDFMGFLPTPFHVHYIENNGKTEAPPGGVCLFVGAGGSLNPAGVLIFISFLRLSIT